MHERAPLFVQPAPQLFKTTQVLHAAAPQPLSAHSLLQTIPASVRAWFQDLRTAVPGFTWNEVHRALRDFVARRLSPRLTQRETAAAVALKDGSLEVTASGAAREVVAAIEIDEGSALELSVRMPQEFPLAPAEVRHCDCEACSSLKCCCATDGAAYVCIAAVLATCAMLLYASGAGPTDAEQPSGAHACTLRAHRHRGIQASLRNTLSMADKTHRKWIFAIASNLRHQNCSVADAIRMWKANVEQQFAGVEPCMICYSVIEPAQRRMPKLKCRTCRQVFHDLCLFKWFKSSSKSTCPHCQAPW